MTLNDVVIHVNESLDPQARHNLEEQMRNINGVIAPRFNDRRIHLMMVAYDADRIQANTLLEAVYRQGYTGQSCGGI